MGLLKQGSPIRGYEDEIMVEIIGIIGGIAAIIISIVTIIGIIAFFGSWKTRVEQWMDQEKKCYDIVPAAVQDLKVKMDLVWQVQTLEVLERQKLAMHNEGPFTKRDSPLAITERGQKCLAEIKPLIDELRSIPDLRPSDIPKLTSEKIGMQNITDMAYKQKCTVGELLSLITVSLGFGL